MPRNLFDETRRTLDCGIKGHKRSTKKQEVANRIAAHYIETKQRINWEGVTCVDFNVFEDERMFLESWLAKCNENSINICHTLD